MFGPVIMFGGVLVFGGVAAPNMAAHEAHPQMNPRVSRFQTVLAAVRARFDILDLFDVWASFKHGHSVPLAVQNADFTFTILAGECASKRQHYGGSISLGTVYREAVG
jgi:hypothetical protein